MGVVSTSRNGILDLKEAFRGTLGNARSSYHWLWCSQAEPDSTYKLTRFSFYLPTINYGFMPGKNATYAMFALWVIMEKCRECQEELHCVFVDLEKAYGRVPKEELSYCMSRSRVAKKYVRMVQDMYKGSVTVVRSAVAVMDAFKVEVGLHQG